MPYDENGQWVEDQYGYGTGYDPSAPYQPPAPVSPVLTAGPAWNTQTAQQVPGFTSTPPAGATPGPNANVAPNASTTPGYAGAKDFTSLVRYWQSSHPASAPDLPGLIAFLNHNGIQASNALHNGMQSDDKLLVNGQTFDLGSSLGGPGASWFSNFEPMGGGGDYNIDPSYLAPYTQQFAAPGDAALPQFQGPGAFHLPTADEVLKDPSYLWEEGRIRDSVQNSASAAGTLNTSGTLDRIMGSVGDFARTNYNNVVARDYGLWNSDWSHALDAYDKQYGRANTVYNRALGEYDLGKQLFQSNQDRPFDKLMRGVDLGSRAASA